MSSINVPHPDRRHQRDRRDRPTSPVTRSSLFGTRKHIRRVEDRQRYFYVDRYSVRAVVTVVATIVLSLTDAVLTLKLVATGAEETNPVMDFFLQRGAVPFLVVKYLLTGTCLVMFLVLKNHRFLRGTVSVKVIMMAVLLMYLLLICYEIILFMQIDSML